jgi:GGDEF domain-containing protein
LPLGADARATLELLAEESHEFSFDDGVVAEAGATVMRTWLAGTVASLDASASMLDEDGVAPHRSAFAARIQEELERARRFDLRLSLILIDVATPSNALGQLEEVLRRELRGSDVTGAMGAKHVAALLTHTDALGLENAVRRVRQRLAAEAQRLNVSDVKLGQAAISPEVRTADALLEIAMRRAEPLIVH